MGCAPAGRVKTLDEFLDFPHLYILFRLVLTHFFQRIHVPLILVGRREWIMVVELEERSDATITRCQNFPARPAGNLGQASHQVWLYGKHINGHGQTRERQGVWAHPHLQEPSSQEARPSTPLSHCPCWRIRNGPTCRTSRRKKLHHHHA
jgi:hypothetical protein